MSNVESVIKIYVPKCNVARITNAATPQTVAELKANKDAFVGQTEGDYVFEVSNTTALESGHLASGMEVVHK
jgi:hypothetical protein